MSEYINSTDIDVHPDTDIFSQVIPDMRIFMTLNRPILIRSRSSFPDSGHVLVWTFQRLEIQDGEISLSSRRRGTDGYGNGAIAYQVKDIFDELHHAQNAPEIPADTIWRCTSDLAHQRAAGLLELSNTLLHDARAFVQNMHETDDKFDIEVIALNHNLTPNGDVHLSEANAFSLGESPVDQDTVVYSTYASMLAMGGVAFSFCSRIVFGKNGTIEFSTSARNWPEDRLESLRETLNSTVRREMDENRRLFLEAVRSTVGTAWALDRYIVIHQQSLSALLGSNPDEEGVMGGPAFLPQPGTIVHVELLSDDIRDTLGDPPEVYPIPEEQGDRDEQ